MTHAELAPESASAICLTFLQALEARDLDRARALTAAGFGMTFPGPAVFEDFGALLAWAAPRYRAISKTIERVEEVPLSESVAVYVTGTLQGERPDGTPFSAIRFIDRFEVRAGLILSQDVWNDLAERGLVT